MSFREDVFLKTVKVLGSEELVTGKTNVIFMDFSKKIVASCANVISVYNSLGTFEDDLTYHHSDHINFLIPLSDTVILSASDQAVIGYDLSGRTDFYKKFEFHESNVKGLLKLENDRITQPTKKNNNKKEEDTLDDKFITIQQNGAIHVFSYSKGMLCRYNFNENPEPQFSSLKLHKDHFLITSGRSRKFMGAFQLFQVVTKNYSSKISCKIKKVRQYRGGHGDHITCIQNYVKEMNHNSQKVVIVTTGKDRNIAFWDTLTSKIYMVIRGVDMPIQKFLVVDRYLVYGVENCVQIYDFRSKIPSIPFEVHKNDVTTLNVMDSSTMRIITVSGKNIVVSQIFKKQRNNRGSMMSFSCSEEDVLSLNEGGEGVYSSFGQNSETGNGLLTETIIEDQVVELHRLRARVKEQEIVIKKFEESNKKLKSRVLEYERNNLPNNQKEMLFNLEKKIEELKKIESSLERRNKHLKDIWADNQKMLDNSRVLNIFKCDDKDIIMGEEIGEGAFGKVYKASWKFDKKIAVKEIFLRPNLPRENVLKEFQDQMSLIDDTVLRVYGYTVGPKRIRILMERMYTDLFEYIKQVRLTVPQKIVFMRKMVQCVHFLHTRKPRVLHRDIKTINFLTDEEGVECKICDFGLLKTQYNQNTFVQSRLKGTLYYLSPELRCRNPKYSPFSDVYSLGVSFWELLMEKYPYDNVEPIVIFEEVTKKKLRPNVEDRNLPVEMKDLMERMWAQEVRARPTTFELLQWFELHEEKLARKYEGVYFPVKSKSKV